MRPFLIWAAVIAAFLAPIIAATYSPFLQYRQPVYIGAGFAGIVGMSLLFFQPLLAEGVLPGINRRISRKAHRWVGAALVLAVGIHVAGLWVTSPPDVLDALLFRAPTPFSVWGVVAMWAVFLSAVLAGLRKKLRIKLWRRWHLSLAIIIVLGSIAHAMLIEGTMEIMTKAAICALVFIAAFRTTYRRVSPRKP